MRVRGRSWPALVLLLVACTHSPAAPPSPAPGGLPPHQLTAQQRAAQQADDLLSRVRVPASATIAQPPAALVKRWSTGGTMTTDKVVRLRWYAVPLGLAAAHQAWSELPPRGLTSSATARGSDRAGPQMLSDTYSGGEPGQLQVVVIRNSPQSSWVLVSSEVVFNPDKPSAEVLAGPALEVTVDGRRLSDPSAQRLLRAFNALTRPPGGGPRSCPMQLSGHVDPVHRVVMRTAQHVARLTVTEGDICTSGVTVIVDRTTLPALNLSDELTAALRLH